MNCSFFAHRDCEYYPCHDMPDGAEVNCLFCFCPLYALGEDCGGDFSYTPGGIKDCSACLLPHTPEGYRYILDQFPRICRAMQRGK